MTSDSTFDPFPLSLPSAQPICEQLHRHAGKHGTSFPLFTVGCFSNKLLVITHDFHVYDLKPKSLVVDQDRLIYQLNLKDGQPVPLCKKWPTLCTLSKRTFPNANYSFMVSQDPNIYLAVLLRSGDGSSVVYNIIEDQIYREVYYNERPARGQIWISSSRSRVYNLIIPASDSSGTLHITRIPLGHIKTRLELYPVTGNRVMCSPPNAPNQVFIRRWCNHSSGEHSILWPVKRGFVANKFFFLLTSDRVVYIFPESSYDNGEPVNFTKVKSKYLYCHKDIQLS